MVSGGEEEGRSIVGVVGVVGIGIVVVGSLVAVVEEDIGCSHHKVAVAVHSLWDG